MIIRFFRALKKHRMLRPLVIWGKRTIYTPYVGRKLDAGDFPREVWIENTNHCNARCVMCPRDSLTRPMGIMNFQLYEKIINEVALHKDTVRRVHLHNYGEPLLDSQLPRRIQLAKQLGLRHVYFVTNGSLLTEGMSRSIIENGLDEFKVSFYGIDDISYNSTMRGLDYNKTLNNIKNFVRVRGELKSSKPSLILQYLPVDSDQSKIELFVRRFQSLLQEEIGDRLNVFALHNYGGGKDYIPLGEIESICHYPWDTFMILQDGTVATCCFDYNGVQVLGDVTKNSIIDIWNNAKYKKLRKDFKRLDYTPYAVCMKCTVTRSPE
jgi:radical SAM protein with 4Fe4S-binding SPASM domain